VIASSAEAHGWASMMLTDEGAIGVASKPAPDPNETGAAMTAAKSTAGKELLEDLSKCTGTLEELDNVIAYLDSDPWKPPSMMTADESKVVDQQEVVLGEEPHSMQYFGIDTDSSRGASTVKADFLYRWIPHNSGFGFLDIARPALGVFASLDRL
jgi:hypothetical protein